MKKKIFDIISGIITAILIVVLFTITYQRVSGQLPNIFGYRILYVQTGSMEPDIKIGDAILVKDCDPLELEVDDVICYKSEAKDTEGMLITHAVYRKAYLENDTYYLVTKGIANYQSDDPIRTDQVVGKMVCKVYLFVYIYKFFKTIPGLITTLLVILVALIKEFINIYKTCTAEEKEETK